MLIYSFYISRKKRASKSRMTKNDKEGLHESGGWDMRREMLEGQEWEGFN